MQEKERCVGDFGRKQNNCHAEEFLLSISTALEKQGGDPRLQASGMTNTINRHAEFISASSRYDNNKTLKQVQGDDRMGFTLIELLVVVLIIGVLAAVALPQYRLLVATTRLSGWIPQMRELQHAQEAYYMENGSYTNKLEKLSVQPPCRRTSTNGHADSYVCDENHFIWVSDYADYTAWHYCPKHNGSWATCYGVREASVSIYHQHITSANKGKLVCKSERGTNWGKDICKRLKL